MKLALLVISLLVASTFPQVASADEWGCEVLLCAASSNPSWHGVEECHPPMERLISEMKRPDFSWPTCPEGGAGKPGYEAFADCPAGWSPDDSGVDDSALLGSQMSRCSHAVYDCSTDTRLFDDARGVGGSNGRRNETARVDRGDGSCRHIEYMARPRREEPYFFDIREQTGDGSVRFYFDLRN